MLLRECSPGRIDLEKALEELCPSSLDGNCCDDFTCSIWERTRIARCCRSFFNDYKLVFLPTLRRRIFRGGKDGEEGNGYKVT